MEAMVGPARRSTSFFTGWVVMRVNLSARESMDQASFAGSSQWEYL